MLKLWDHLVCVCVCVCARGGVKCVCVWSAIETKHFLAICACVFVRGRGMCVRVCEGRGTCV